MSYVFQSGGAPAAPTALLRLAANMRSALRSFLHDVKGAWAYAAARNEFSRLDSGTLRDLGMSRGEFESYWAETHGTAEPTRERVIQRVRGRNGL
jgi:uncharacterized protein YjiS (DUF1127 family)